jgi:hypothetical protein
MKDDKFVEVDETDDEYEVVMYEKFMNEKGFDSNDSLAWDLEDQHYEEWHDRETMSK